MLVIIGNLIAWPFAYYAAGTWQADFAYRDSFSPWPFLVGLALLIVIVLGFPAAIGAAAARLIL